MVGFHVLQGVEEVKVVSTLTFTLVVALVAYWMPGVEYGATERRLRVGPN
jgi:hypothetical protein